MGAAVQKNKAITWCDDFLIGSHTEDEMIDNLGNILQCAEDNGITFSAFKGNFLKQEVEFAGCHWTPEGVKADDSKIKVMKEFPTPTNRKQLRSFLGLASWFRSFINNFAEIATPLYESTKGTNQEKFIWTHEQEKAFNELRNAMSSRPVISYPREDLPIYIYCDASDVALGWIVCQYEDPDVITNLAKSRRIPKSPDEIEKLNLKGFLLGYGAKKLDTAGKRRSIHYKEVRAIQLALRNFHSWTAHAQVHVLTDRSSILDIFKRGKQKQQHWNSEAIDRILLELECYDLTIQYIPTDKNPSDCISRTLNLPQTDVCEEELNTAEHTGTTNESNTPDSCHTNEETSDSDDDYDISPDERTIPRESRYYEYILDDALAEEFAPCKHDECNMIHSKPKATTDIEIPRTIKYLQETCPKLKHIYELLENPNKPLSKEAVKHMDQRSIMQIHQYFINKEGQLQYLYDIRANKNQPMNSKGAHRELLVVPLCLRKKVIDQAHRGHCSPQRVQELLLRKYFWPGMYGEVRKYVSSCVTCTRSNNRTQKPLKLTPETIPTGENFVFSSMAIDLQGPWPLSRKKHFRYTLTATDLVTRYTWIIGLKEATSIHIAKALYHEVFPTFGTPSRVHSDLGSNLISQSLTEFLRLMGVTSRTVTSTRHPSSNSVVERQHFTVNSFLRKKLKGISSGLWEDHLTELNYVIRHSMNRGIGASPTYLMTGAPINQNLFDVRAPADGDAIPRDSFKQFVGGMSYMRKAHYEWLNHQREMNIKKFNKDKAVKMVRKIRPGDIVVARTDQHVVGGARKLEYKYSKPLRVISHDKKKTTYVLQDIETGKELPNKWNYNNIRLCVLPSQCKVRNEYNEEIDKRRKEYYPKSKPCKIQKKSKNQNQKINEQPIRAIPTRIQPPRRCKNQSLTEEVNSIHAELYTLLTRLNNLNAPLWPSEATYDKTYPSKVHAKGRIYSSVNDTETGNSEQEAFTAPRWITKLNNIAKGPSQPQHRYNEAKRHNKQRNLS